MSSKHLSCESSAGFVPSKGCGRTLSRGTWAAKWDCSFFLPLLSLEEVARKLEGSRKLLFEGEEQQKEQRNLG